MLRSQIPNWRQTASRSMHVSTYPAVRLTATASPGGVPHHGEYLLVLAKRQQVTIMLSCPMAQRAQFDQAFEQAIQSAKVR